ncbi:MAG: type II toxin-antitoxin system death-on-curing family toxin [Acidobacteria bacterium]|nr:type II toxin-antitoxin system death-on-curing family toxin [Thermoanaerobaculia bacterium]NLN12223.1 type II toxin-antitoxin system death-on-curing family toxin [Acidobacteriota bacterium]MBP7814412.1 type II toxin-antitoxin system death-on-curing family toxin [Thermoanaerobaculia bacterium]MBP8845236.1 type II toxin-antitoxin system death-on-curing family toxin [Thermoanaerobaculia bacterium]HNZ95714.1 type II toxin-antitoxin system death-on-curing family toxin [Thermoanaerobaculia bacteri
MRFLALEEVLALHAEQIRRFGGAPGLRDPALLASALAMPRATFGGEPLHATPWEAAAACLFHLARNHPFVDGNKRTALAAALVFLGLNGFTVEAGDDAVTGLVVGVASGAVSKSEAAVFLQHHGSADG